jgi:hypothetical protein
LPYFQEDLIIFKFVLNELPRASKIIQYLKYPLPINLIKFQFIYLKSQSKKRQFHLATSLQAAHIGKSAAEDSHIEEINSKAHY